MTEGDLIEEFNNNIFFEASYSLSQKLEDAKSKFSNKYKIIPINNYEFTIHASNKYINLIIIVNSFSRKTHLKSIIIISLLKTLDYLN